MSEVLKKSFNALIAVIPVFAVVLILHLTEVSVFSDKEIGVLFISSSLLIVGMAVFSVGAEASVQRMGELIGSSITKKRSLILLIIIFFLFGVLIVLAEPDLAIISEQVITTVKARLIVIFSVAFGVGLFLVIGALRILFQKSLKVWLLGFYGLMFAICCLVDYAHIPLSIDSGGATSGFITVPFVIAVGFGIASSRAGSKSDADSFGLIAFTSIGPILVVLILSLLMKDCVKSYDVSSIMNFTKEGNLISPFVNSLIGLNGFPFKVLISTLPILSFFLIYNLIFIKLPFRKLKGLLIGFLLVYFGLVIFLTAIKAGFMPLGMVLGKNIAFTNPKALVIIGCILGFIIVFAEPTVHILLKQIESVSGGSINKVAVLLAIALGNAFALAIAMLRIKFGFNIFYIIVPGYTLAFIISFIVPDIYSAISFDAGGAVSGPLNSTFILSFAIGACYGFKGEEVSSMSILTDAFGTISLVALMPLLMVQILGLSAIIRNASERKIARLRTTTDYDNQIIHF